MSERGRVVEVPAASAEFMERRVSELLTLQGLALAENNILKLMCFAYGQGCDDAVQALEMKGINLSGLASHPKTEGEKP